MTLIVRGSGVQEYDDDWNEGSKVSQVQDFAWMYSIAQAHSAICRDLAIHHSVE
jgi:hypothetical protein